MLEKGYFCTVKYLHNPIRDENINIGVILYSVEDKKIHYQLNMESALKKIKRFYPGFEDQCVKKLITELEEAIEYLNDEDRESNNPIEQLKSWFRTGIMVSECRAFMIESLYKDLQELYNQQVSFKEEEQEWLLQAREIFTEVIIEDFMQKQILHEKFIRAKIKEEFRNGYTPRRKRHKSRGYIKGKEFDKFPKKVANYDSEPVDIDFKNNIYCAVYSE